MSRVAVDGRLPVTAWARELTAGAVGSLSVLAVPLTLGLLAFAPLGALMVAGFMWLWLRKKLSPKYIYVFCLAGIGMHGVLDSMTNYGTHLFWPFSNQRESWSIISIIDPIFTLTLLAFLICAVRARARHYAIIGAIFAMSYWSLVYLRFLTYLSIIGCFDSSAYILFKYNYI